MEEPARMTSAFAGQDTRESSAKNQFASESKTDLQSNVSILKFLIISSPFLTFTLFLLSCDLSFLGRSV